MKFAKYLANLGYGTRREVERLFDAGRITNDVGSVLADSDAFSHDDVRVDDEPLDPRPASTLLFNKPVGYVCSTREASRLIYELLPSRFRDRSPVMAPVGRLDRDTSGLLLLTDDGQLNHRVTSPKTHLPKVYEAELDEPLRGDEGALFASGTLVLESDTEPLRPAALDVVTERKVRLTLTEGRYHQVRRMFAAVGNNVRTLHRTALGGLELGALPSGAWRTLDADEIRQLFTAPA